MALRRLDKVLNALDLHEPEHPGGGDGGDGGDGGA